MSDTITEQPQLCPPPVTFDENGAPLPRPKRTDKPVGRRAAELLATRVMEVYPFRITIEKLTDDLADDMWYGDGFEIGKRLERKGYKVNGDLVETLNDAEDVLYTATAEAVADWVKLYNIKPQFKIGDQVRFVTRTGKGLEQGEFVGTIYKINEQRAMYIIRCEALGHVPEGQQGVNGIGVEYEKAQAVQPETNQMEVNSDGN